MMLKIISFPFSGFPILNEGIKVALGVDLSKNLTFDENGEEEIDKCIVLIRSFELALEDWWQPALGDFQTFRDSKVDYFDNFMAKWVNSQIPNRLTLTYLDLTSDTLNAILKAYGFITSVQMPQKALDDVRAWMKGKTALNLLKSGSNTQNIDNQPLSYFHDHD